MPSEPCAVDGSAGVNPTSVAELLSGERMTGLSSLTPTVKFAVPELPSLSVTVTVTVKVLSSS